MAELPDNSRRKPFSADLGRNPETYVQTWRYRGFHVTSADSEPFGVSDNLRSKFDIAKGTNMRAAYYERNGTAREALKLGEVETPRPGPGEVRVKLATSGVNPSDVKSRSGATRKIAYPRVIPHSDGGGEIDMVGAGVLPHASASVCGFGRAMADDRSAPAPNTSRYRPNKLSGSRPTRVSKRAPASAFRR